MLRNSNLNFLFQLLQAVWLVPKCRMHSFCPCLLFEKKIFGGLPVARAALLLHCNDHVIAAMVFGLAWGERQMFSRRRCICLPMQQHFWAQGPQNPKYPHFRKNPNHIVVFFRILLCGKRKIYFLGYESMKHPVPHSSNSSNTKRPFSFAPFRFVPHSYFYSKSKHVSLLLLLLLRFRRPPPTSGKRRRRRRKPQ